MKEKKAISRQLSAVSILGAGGFGTAIAILLAKKGRFDCLCLWTREERRALELRGLHENRRYLPDVKIPESVKITSHLADAVASADVLVLAVPSHGVRELCQRLASLKANPNFIVNLAKGIEVGTSKRMSEVAAETLGKKLMTRYVALSGPGFAAEIARGLPSATVVASRNPKMAGLAQQLFMTETYRVYSSTDVVGVELGGALKNVIAIAAGVSDGIGFGDSAKAALVTRGLAEMARLGVALGGTSGGKAETFYGLSGAGDLMDTCFSQQSRNRGVGERLGRGETLAHIQSSMSMVAEGVRTARAAKGLVRLSNKKARGRGRAEIDTPIIDEVNAILYKGKSPKEAVHDLMTRSAKPETR